ncbi:MAG TPA: ABC transporter ATP-binding protein [Candidatus Elarobacter sp.]|nr:ABC transporter ATP-binding protein [Candidatus Elarobacter sp.]
MTTPAIEFKEVTKVYRRRLAGQEVPALTHVSFEVGAGEVCAFLGPNGAGKTTSINILMGFLYADYGKIRVLGYDPGDVRAKQKTGFVPENFAFYKHLNAEKLLRFHLALAGGDMTKSIGLIRDLLFKVQLQGYEKLKIGKYSRGMVQRLGIAQALLSDPQLLVLDEPTSGLDPAGRKEVKDLIHTMKGEGKTIFLSSHILSEVEQICDRAIIIDKGRLVRMGSLHELLGTGDHVEILANGLSPEVEAALVEWGATIERGPNSVRITVPVTRKRELVENLWASGFDVLSMNPVRSSLEELYLKLIGTGVPV